jgi:hypothetical protein
MFITSTVPDANKTLQKLCIKLSGLLGILFLFSGHENRRKKTMKFLLTAVQQQSVAFQWICEWYIACIVQS